MRRRRRFAVVVKLKPFRLFKRNIEPHLRCIIPNQRDHTGTELYRLAKTKTDIEFWQSVAPEVIPENRKQANQFKRMGNHLASARKAVEKAMGALGEGARDFLADDVDWDGILREIDGGLQAAATLRKANAAIIHPDLRTATETKLVRPGDEVESHGGPTPGVHVSDYWFIEHGQRLLARCRKTKAQKLQSADINRIISKAFCFALDECAWTAGRIKSALRRIKLRPRPKYTLPYPDTPVTDRKAFAIPDTKKLPS